MNINITNSTVGNINLGQQIGHIEAIAKTIASKQGGDNQHFAEALRALTDAIKNAQELKDTDKVEAAQASSEIAEQGNVEPQKRSHGKLKALLAGFPTLIAGAAHLTKLWETWGPGDQGVLRFLNDFWFTPGAYKPESLGLLTFSLRHHRNHSMSLARGANPQSSTSRHRAVSRSAQPFAFSVFERWDSTTPNR